MAKSGEIVDRLLTKIGSGELAPGDRLPTHRELAWDMKCSVGTVTRAYAELERRGIVYGQVGRGTFVFGTGRDKQEIGSGMFMPTADNTRQEPDQLIDLSLNRFYHPQIEMAYKQALELVSKNFNVEDYSRYFDCRGRPVDAAAAQEWMESLIGPLEKRNILITQGAQSGLFLAMSALANAGDSIATEEFGYPGIKAAAQELGLRISAIEMDDQGMIPEAFESVARRGKLKILVTVPTNHNPTGSTLSLDRRKKIVTIAREHHISIVEDGVYNPLQRNRLPSFWELAPDISLYLTSFSKLFSPGLRVGHIVAPDKLIPRLVNRMTVINWMTSPLTLDVVNVLLKMGTLYQQQDDLLTENQRRYSLACKLFEPWMSKGQMNVRSPLSHIWVKLPATMATTDFVTQAKEDGILLIGGDRFAMNRQLDDNYVRVCLMSVPDYSVLENALSRLKALLQVGETRALIS
ncbi:aminotransferase-like domain-containing protein [Sneathiella aquimaris]|uniref:aminotransferase-like domain-containing protein n=1 Tax=Sneathiella aquimaris TaxID=2599305 RepID=UPI00146B7100|nr:PLP-dependent aminotransferase family protein [Sneathiella aquimaris]